MAIPYAALIGLAVNASSNIGDQISRAYRGGNPELEREKMRIDQAYYDAIARKYGYNVNYAGTMGENPVNAPSGPLIGNQPGLGAAIQAIGGMGGGGAGATPEDVTKSDFFKHSGDYADVAAAEQGGGGLGGGSGASVIPDGIASSDWYKNSGRPPLDLLQRRWHPDDEKDPWGRL